MEKRIIKKVAVLGSGVMGSRIACHFAGIGLPVLLLDIVPKEAVESKKPAERNKIVNDALAAAIKSNPSPVYHKNVIKKITTGNFDDDMKKIGDCDWVIEVVVERLDIKKQVYEKELLGKELGDSSWKAIKADGTPFPWYEFPTVVSLQTGFPQRNVKMGVNLPNGVFVWLLINSEALIRIGEFDPYAVVVSFSDITDNVNREEELRKSNERFFYVSKITSDAIWDIDLATKQIYRSETFYELSGYSPEEIKPDLDWWFNKVHPKDRERVKNKVQDHIQNGHERWEDEYLFLCADGSYKFLLDSGTIQYRHGKPVRILGAIRDLTEKKKLQQQLLQEQEQKHKAVSQAGIAAQEAERSSISRELHDNVNQLLMSAKLFMNSAQTDPEKADEHIEKAITYQLMAVEEIRKLSKTLNTSLVKVIGLSRSIDDIIINMKAFQQIETRFNYDQKLDKVLSDDQKLMIFRILQEQTNNIIKYADAKNVTITLKEENNTVYLSIKDDGKGFDASIQSKGIGFINIYNRVDAFGGEMELISSPGNGCSLEINFPLIFN